MADIQKQFEELMKVVAEERILRQKGEAALAEARRAAELAATVAAENLAKANAVALAASAAATQKGPKMGLPEKFSGSRGAKAERWVNQIGLYMIANAHLFPDDRTKVLWSLSYLDGQALEWANQFAKKLFQAEFISYDGDFAKAFISMYFDTEKKTRAEASLRKLKQTKSVADYTHQFNVHAHHTGWEVTTLISHYRQGLKSNVRLALIILRADFTTLADISNLSLKIDNELNGGKTHTGSLTGNDTTPDPNAMDVSALNGRLSDSEKTRMMRAGLCFRCSARGHLSRDCPEKIKKGKQRDAQIAELEEEIRGLKAGRDDAYDGILGMPWLRKFGHQIDWSVGRFRIPTGAIAATEEASSIPKTALEEGTRPQGNARINDEGVCVFNTVALPQCKLASLPHAKDIEETGKHSFVLGRDQDPKGGDLSHGETLRPAPGLTTTTTHSFAHSHRPSDGRGLLASEAAADDAVTEVAARTELTDLGKDDESRGQKRLEVSPTPNVRTCRLDAATVNETLPYATFVSLFTDSVPRLASLATAQASWLTSAKIAVDQKKSTQPMKVEDMIPACYHQFLRMFYKKEAQALPPRQVYDFKVELIPGATPQTSRPIPLSPAEDQALQTLVEEGLANGTIRCTTSPWAAPVLFTGKKDGSLRPCFDYRKLNSVTVKNRYPLPLTMELVDSLRDAGTFTKLDLRNAYGNLRVAEGDEDKLAFVCKAGQFAPLTMPFGPTRAPGYFQYFMQDILVGRVGRDTAVYLDDILIYTPEGDDHEEAVRSILLTLGKHQLWLKPEKCEFSRAEVEYLGLLISKNRVKMDPGKVSAVTEWPAPRNVRELQRFIGFANFYRRFIDHFSGTARPLHDLTRDNAMFNWNDTCQKAFDALKTAFATAPVLKIANPYEAFVLECDCSDFALGAILSQICKTDGELYPVAFLSRSLIKAERNYQIFDKELLAIVAAFKEWRHYLEGNPHRLNAIVYTDHQNLESFMTTKELTRRQARWAETMGCFDFDIVFRPGRESTKPDALSRRPDLAPDRADKLSFGQLLRPENITPETFTAITEFDMWFEDESVHLDDAEHWFHIDVMGTNDIEEEPIWPDHEILSRIQSCRTKQCGATKRNREEPARQQAGGTSRTGQNPGASATLFHMAIYEKVHKLVRGWMRLVPTSKIDNTEAFWDTRTPANTGRALDGHQLQLEHRSADVEFIQLHTDSSRQAHQDGALRPVHKGTQRVRPSGSDAEAHVEATRHTQDNRRLGIRLHPSTAYHPRTDGQSEIVNKAVEQYIQHFVGYHQDDWEPLLATAEFAYNNNTHSLTLQGQLRL
ncbi:hypothetical protein MJO29_007066 [Puccinia striiformis f. sp. tritici]|nr:hypothetical protein MJO29_007066 [Puccinia striiformis f. sp. tritici]